MVLIQLEAMLSKLFFKGWRTHHIHRPYLKILLNIDSRGFPGCKDFIVCDRQPETRNFFCVLAAMFGGIIRQEEIVPTQLVQGLDEAQGTIDQLIAEIERAVHIQQKALHVLQGFSVHKLILAACSKTGKREK